MKSRRNYRISIEDESHLSEVASGRFTRLSFSLVVLLFLLLSFSVAGAIIAFTPLRTLLPGYMKESQRAETEESFLRLDSLMNAYEVSQQYIRNYLRVTNVDREPGDSVSVSRRGMQEIDDTLSVPTVREQRFVDQMEERERYNISVLAPLAADGLGFSSVVDKGIFSSDSKNSETATVLFPEEEGVKCAADGTVIALYHSPALHGFTAVVQHARGFATSYGGVGSILAGVGEHVNAGQVIALSPKPDSKGVRKMQIRMWHNGQALKPYDYLGDPGLRQSVPGESYEDPRGK